MVNAIGINCRSKNNPAVAYRSLHRVTDLLVKFLKSIPRKIEICFEEITGEISTSINGLGLPTEG